MMYKILVAGAGILVVVALFVAKLLYDERAPDYMEMRSYLVSQLGDDQIRKAHADAQNEFERQYAQQKKELEESRGCPGGC
jgi:hypothetical protein